MQSPQEIAKMIKEEARNRGISINLLLGDCGLKRSTIENMKDGSMPSADKLYKIADYFGLTVDYLLTGKQQKNNQPTLRLVEDPKEDTYMDMESLIRSARNVGRKKQTSISLIITEAVKDFERFFRGYGFEISDRNDEAHRRVIAALEDSEWSIRLTFRREEKFNAHLHSVFDEVFNFEIFSDHPGEGKQKYSIDVFGNSKLDGGVEYFIRGEKEHRGKGGFDSMYSTLGNIWLSPAEVERRKLAEELKANDNIEDIKGSGSHLSSNQKDASYSPPTPQHPNPKNS